MKYLVIVLAILFICIPVQAAQTGTTAWHSHSYTDKDSFVDKYGDYQKKQNWPMGIGVDAIMYEFTGPLKYDYCLDSINTETKYDIANGSMSVYAVAHVNVWRAIDKLI